MRINTRLKVAALAPLAMALAIGAAILFASGASRTAQQRSQTAERLIRSMNDLHSLVGGYFLHPHERSRQQFLAEQETAARLLRSMQVSDPEQQRLVEALRESTDVMREMFLRMVAIHEQHQSRPEGEEPGRDEGRIAGGLLVRSRQAVTDGLRLQTLVRDQAAATHARINLLVLSVLLLVTLPLTVLLLRMMNKIGHSLISLERGAEAVGGGCLDHRVGLSGEDELAALGRAFDRMTQNLQAMTVSKSELEREIQERKRANEALQESERLYRGIGESIKYGIWVCDAQGRNTYASESFLKLVGMTPQECSDMGWTKALHPDDAEATVAAWSQCAQAGRTWYREHRFRGVDGQWHPVLACGVPVRNEQGVITCWAGINLDISRLKQTEEELRKAKDELAETNANLEKLVAERTAKLQELVAELEHFSYTITHDLKSPLRAMRGFAEIATLAYEEGAQIEAKEFLGRISTAADRMDALIRDALNYSRAVREELPLEDVDTGALLRGMLDSYPELQASKARIRVEGTLPVVLANEAGLTQCLSNLLGNAVKFVKPGEMPEIRVWAEAVQGRARIWVEDKGIGISKEMLPRVFDMFSRASKNYEGTGIGLALVRKVAHRMGGRAGVESEEGQGSRFWLELKTAEKRPAPDILPTAPNREPSGGTVLYVEDEEGDAHFMERAFVKKGLGPALRLVGDGRTAIDYLSGAGRYADRKEYPLPSVVLLDLNLPQVPGFEVLRWMRNHPDFATTPVVVLSSSTREDDRVKAQELGANEFLVKPKSGLEFGSVVDSLSEKWLVNTLATGSP